MSGSYVAIVGSRGYRDELRVRHYVRHELEPDDIVVSGGAQGPDSWAEDEAQKCGHVCCIYLPDYETHGRGAPLVRNSQIVTKCDFVVAFWNGTSRGTLDTIQKAIRAGKRVLIIPEPLIIIPGDL